MKRLVCRVEGSGGEALKLAFSVLRNCLEEQGTRLCLMYIGDGPPYPNSEQELSTLCPAWVENCISSFSQAQAIIEERTALGMNALIITGCFMDWSCPGDVINGPLEEMEFFLQRQKISVALLEEEMPGCQGGRGDQQYGMSELRQCAVSALESYDEKYCGEEFVLPYGALPVFTAEPDGFLYRAAVV